MEESDIPLDFGEDYIGNNSQDLLHALSGSSDITPSSRSGLSTNSNSIPNEAATARINGMRQDHGVTLHNNSIGSNRSISNNNNINSISNHGGKTVGNGIMAGMMTTPAPVPQPVPVPVGWTQKQQQLEHLQQRLERNQEMQRQQREVQKQQELGRLILKEQSAHENQSINSNNSSGGSSHNSHNIISHNIISHNNNNNNTMLNGSNHSALSSSLGGRGTFPTAPLPQVPNHGQHQEQQQMYNFNHPQQQQQQMLSRSSQNNDPWMGSGTGTTSTMGSTSSVGSVHSSEKFPPSFPGESRGYGSTLPFNQNNTYNNHDNSSNNTMGRQATGPFASSTLGELSSYTNNNGSRIDNHHNSINQGQTLLNTHSMEQERMNEVANTNNRQFSHSMEQDRMNEVANTNNGQFSTSLSSLNNNNNNNHNTSNTNNLLSSSNNDNRVHTTGNSEYSPTTSYLNKNDVSNNDNNDNNDSNNDSSDNDFENIFNNSMEEKGFAPHPFSTTGHSTNNNGQDASKNTNNGNNNNDNDNNNNNHVQSNNASYTPSLVQGATDVIELLEDEDDDDDGAPVTLGNIAKRARLGNNSSNISDHRNNMLSGSNADMSPWMKKRKPGFGIPVALPGGGRHLPPGVLSNNNKNNFDSLPSANMLQQLYNGGGNNMEQKRPHQHNHHHQQQRRRPQQIHPPEYLQLPSDFIPRWDQLMPVPKPQKTFRSFALSLLNVREFTITGLSVNYDGPPSSVAGLRTDIKKMARSCGGKAVFDRDVDGVEGGRWRIPLGAYHSFFAFLNNDPMCAVEGIPEHQLKIASLGKAHMDKGYPSSKKLISQGVPKGLATALAPFQRGGVDFVIEKGGRALIADDMGLGKTIQAIASVSVYHKEWPILVLTPSSARYHWEAEFQNWLGAESNVNTQKGVKASDITGDGEIDDDDDEKEEAPAVVLPSMTLLKDSEIHVLTTSKEDILPHPYTRVVICSYGLAPSLVENGKIGPGLFRCAIVDESHMLKNMATKRTSALVPVLHATNRCILLSGTPALSRPSELWPQLKILGTEQHGWWEDEAEFVKNYVKRSSPARRAELHTMLTGTVMIRRLKTDILKSLQNKRREKAIVDVVTNESRSEFHQCMVLLREGKGVLGKLARQHTSLGPTPPPPTEAVGAATDGSVTETIDLEKKKAELREEYQNRLTLGHNQIRHALAVSGTQLDELQQRQFLQTMQNQQNAETEVWYRERLHELHNPRQVATSASEAPARATVLNKMYTLTAKAKIPLIVNMVKKWLDDPSKGKLCIFAHHIFVLDGIVEQVGLSNDASSDKKYIRIDGSTSPRDRQAQIKAFQGDPSVRVAVLGITAAGVAVTLTASSTVWFAELFWTPALMIQAEDRCHRIGQNARVECLYFVAVGTLDEILWKLLEKKFRDLGEFVEGKEKLKLVIERTYHGVKELQAIFDAPPDDEADGGVANAETEGEEEDVLDIDINLEKDIEELAKEELTMLLPADADEDEIELLTKPEADNAASSEAGAILGRSEEDAILLSDDEEESPAQLAGTSSAAVPDRPKSEDTKKDPFKIRGVFNTMAKLPNSRHYTMLFSGPDYGMQLKLFESRAVVCRRLVSGSLKPACGDILAAINGSQVLLVHTLQEILLALRNSMARRPPVRLTFVEDKEFQEYFKRAVRAESIAFQEQQRLASLQRKPRQEVEEVIDLLDDD